MSDFRRFLPAPGKARYFGKTHQQTLDALPQVRTERWKARLEQLRTEPFRGVTTDGSVVPGLFALRDERAPTAAILEAVSKLLGSLPPEQRDAILHPMESIGRRMWVNEVPRYETFGVWLDQMTPASREAAYGVMRASLSSAGYDKARDIMKLNGFLGELVGVPIAFNELCFQMHVFGTPSASEPWGWQIYGHHFCITCFIVGTQMTVTPTFMGAEPRFADEGQHAGVRVFDDEERLGLELMRSMGDAQRLKAVVHDTLLPGNLPPGRHQGPDGMCLAGSFKDNVIIPYEGITGADLDTSQRKRLLDLTACYLSTLPHGPLQAHMGDVERHIAKTHFCWAGGIAEDSAFYYRIQSPVVLIEFDHQKGVVLTNETPKRFHTHTIVRTPNGNDYGMDLLRQHYETSPHHKPSTSGGSDLHPHAHTRDPG